MTKVTLPISLLEQSFRSDEERKQVFTATICVHSDIAKLSRSCTCAENPQTGCQASSPDPSSSIAPSLPAPQDAAASYAFALACSGGQVAV
jgi:hypothetical protein